MLESGSRLGNYQIEALLGQGGMGVVYEAVQLSLSRRVALKVIAPELSRNERFQERFRREGRAQAALDHPNVVTVHDFGETDGQLYISMQLVRGPSLKELIHRGELDLGRVQRILRPIADALDTAHEKGMIHRDFKPQNILVGSRDHAYLADFGLTQAYGEPGLTRTGQFVGTLDYIAPEQIHGRPATRRSDVYSFGAVLFECLTGTPPYPRESDAATLFAHVSEPLPRVSELRPGAPATIDDVLIRALAKNPDERLPTATAVMDELEHALGGAPPAVASTPRTASKAGPPPRNRKPMLVSLATMLIALASGCGAVLAFTRDDKPKPPVVTPHERYVKAVDAFWKPATTQIKAAQQQLAADSPQAQQRAADGLAGIYAAARTKLQALKPPPPDAADHAQFLDGLQDANEASTSQAKAVANNSSPGFDTAERNRREAEARIDAAVTAIYGSAQ
jgi:serine/threonine-protein kinase